MTQHSTSPSMERLLTSLRAETAALPIAGPRVTALLANLEAVHANEMQELMFEVSLYKKEALRLQEENERLKRENDQVRAELQAERITGFCERTPSTPAPSTGGSSSNTQTPSSSLSKSSNSSYSSSSSVSTMSSPVNSLLALSQHEGDDRQSVSPSPTTAGQPTSGGAPGGSDATGTMGSPILPEADLNCESNLGASIPLLPPYPNHYQGNHGITMSFPVPSFKTIMNYNPLSLNNPQSMGSSGLPQQKCTMCGEICAYGHKPKDGTSPFIPRQNKGICTACDVKVWILTRRRDGSTANTNRGLYLKWCKGCKNFQHWAAFGTKGWATKCQTCRKRMADKYAEKKESSKRSRIII